MHVNGLEAPHAGTIRNPNGTERIRATCKMQNAKYKMQISKCKLKIAKYNTLDAERKT
jgi:hypothetical protein